MIYLYPANKMENLLLLLNKISQLSPLGVFNQEVIVVQNAGMQHWLNLAIAKERGISMNMRYALPAQFLWKLMRSVASEDKVPDQAPYSREVLTWRIYQLLALDSVIEDDDFSQATLYWRGEKVEYQDSTKEQRNVDNKGHLKRYQLATQLADLYEQYLIFRPQWLNNWQQGHYEIDGLEKSSTREHKWQGKLWQLLIAQQAYNPVELLADAIANIPNKKDLIPPRISFFGLNTMAPMWLDFINALSEHVEIHFFHLNPCFSYWGDILTEKQALNKLSQWSDGIEDVQHFVGNPLLANFGQQGREFISLLQDYSTIDIELFEQAEISEPFIEQLEEVKPNVSILHQIQNDILSLTDARLDNTKQHSDMNGVQRLLIDDSIVITSCHSALREVQGLHDYLLHQFNQDETLTPKDVLVMCPQIEQYAPYVNAVFTKGWQDIAGEVPPLPCSIADRSAKDSDPLVAAFTQLLTLPDSRFSVSELLSFLRLPAMAGHFSIAPEDLNKVSVWLEHATVHWGLDLAHKQSLLGPEATASFTWQQGLSRLLRGFTFADSEQVYQEQLLLSNVEGSDAILLGQLMLFIEQLQFFSQELQTSRSAEQWQRFLLDQLSNLFSRIDVNNVSNETSLMVIEQAIAGLIEHCHEADYQAEIPLLIVVDYLTQHFSQGDASKQFMVGQVTFCSMLPMRSIPFKVIAVLGLNDGEFPRQRQPLGFDLMSLASPKLGDRSRRGDDRYLFLEAIISARNSLYLSYQGRNIKNNGEKQPSLVVKELMEYLVQGYGWSFSPETSAQTLTEPLAKDATDHSGHALKSVSALVLDRKGSSSLYQLPMQAFSINNYQGKWASFDPNWLSLGRGKTESTDQTTVNKPLIINTDEIRINLASGSQHTVIELSSQQLIRFYQHPSKVFAQHNLNVFFEQGSSILEDVEPFSVNQLQSYLLRQQLLEASLLIDNEKTNKVSETSADAIMEKDNVLTRARLSGKFPDLPSTEILFEGYQEDVQQFGEEIIKQGCDNPDIVDCTVNLEVSDQTVVLSTQLAVKSNLLVHYRSSTAKAKDKFSMYVQQLILLVWQQQNVDILPSLQNSVQSTENQEKLQQVRATIGLYFNTKSQKVEQFNVATIDNAKQKLINIINIYFKGQQQALLLNGDIAEHVFTKKRGQTIEMTQERFESIWLGDLNTRGLSDDDYLAYFWPECPQYTTIQQDLECIYQDLYQMVVKQSASKSSKSSVTLSSKKANAAGSESNASSVSTSASTSSNTNKENK